jgi:hypothetical protein
MPPRISPPADEYLTQDELSGLLKVPVNTLRHWRSKGRGPGYIRGESDSDKATIRYPLSEVEAWKKRCLVVPAGT